MIVRISTLLALLLSASFISCVTLSAQAQPPSSSAEPPPSSGRVGFEVAVGPARDHGLDVLICAGGPSRSHSVRNALIAAGALRSNTPPPG